MTWRGAGAVFAGFVAVFVLSLGTDEVLHVLAIYPPWGEPMRDPRVNLLALSYRVVYDTFGSYLTARLAPRNPMRHVWVGAAIGLVLTSAGAVAAMQMDIGPLWYPIALALSTLPTAWLGGTLYVGADARVRPRGRRMGRPLHDAEDGVSVSRP